MSAGLSEQQLAEIRALLDGAPPAKDELIVTIAEAYRDRREHEHPKRAEDWFCTNLAGWMGDRMPVVLSRLLDAETEVARLRAALSEAADQVAERDAEIGGWSAQVAELESALAGVDNRARGAAARLLGDAEDAPAVPRPVGPPLSEQLVAQIRARHDAAECGGLYMNPEPFGDPNAVRATIGGVPQTLAVMDFRGWKANENRQFVLHAHDDVRLLLDDRARYADRADLVSRVHELELALGSAVAELRSAAMHVNAGQVPDAARLCEGADELEQVQSARAGRGESS